MEALKAIIEDIVSKGIIESIVARLGSVMEVVETHEGKVESLEARVTRLEAILQQGEEAIQRGELRCEKTGNPCGTDIWGNGYKCDCAACGEYLACKINGLICDHDWGPWVDATNKAVESGEMRLCSKCERFEIRAVPKHKGG